MKLEFVKGVELQLKYFLFQVAVDIFTVVLVGKLIEPLWGALEMMTFFFIVNTGKSLVPVLLLLNPELRCGGPLCDFLLPPLHGHGKCGPLIPGIKPLSLEECCRYAVLQSLELYRCISTASLATLLV